MTREEFNADLEVVSAMIDDALENLPDVPDVFDESHPGNVALIDVVTLRDMLFREYRQAKDSTV